MVRFLLARPAEQLYQPGQAKAFLLAEDTLVPILASMNIKPYIHRPVRGDAGTRDGDIVEAPCFRRLGGQRTLDDRALRIRDTENFSSQMS